jgi:hypothetical protein
VSTDRMESTATLAGFFTAHAVWSIAEGGPLAPVFGFLRHSGLREFTRLEQDPLEAAVAAGQALLAGNDEGFHAAVLVYDGYVTLPSGRRDALIIEARRYPEAAAMEGFDMVLPYRPAGDPAGFAVHRPKFVDLDDPEGRSLVLSTAFFRGVNEHREAAPVWRRAMDDSL